MILHSFTLATNLLMKINRLMPEDEWVGNYA